MFVLEKKLGMQSEKPVGKFSKGNGKPSRIVQKEPGRVAGGFRDPELIKESRKTRRMIKNGARRETASNIRSKEGLSVGIAFKGSKDKAGINELLKRAQNSTASAGRFDPKLKREDKIKVQVKKKLIRVGKPSDERNFCIEAAKKFMKEKAGMARRAALAKEHAKEEEAEHGTKNKKAKNKT